MGQKASDAGYAVVIMRGKCGLQSNDEKQSCICDLWGSNYFFCINLINELYTKHILVHSGIGYNNMKLYTLQLTTYCRSI